MARIREIVETEARVRHDGLPLSADGIRALKMMGFTDARLAKLTGREEGQVRRARERLGVTAVFKRIDTCAAEFEAYTPYYYSTYDRGDDEVTPSTKKKIMILGGGPNRIGQGIEFDYCCVHAAFALKEDGYETLMVNSNRRPFPPTTTPATSSSSSPSLLRMFCTSTSARVAPGPSPSSAVRPR